MTTPIKTRIDEIEDTIKNLPLDIKEFATSNILAEYKRGLEEGYALALKEVEKIIEEDILWLEEHKSCKFSEESFQDWVKEKKQKIQALGEKK
jgi:hypothetical protein